MSKQAFSDSTIIYSSRERKLTDKQISDKKCTKCEEKGSDSLATHKSNFIGTRKLLCDKHAELFRQKNSQLPSDLASIEKL